MQARVIALCALIAWFGLVAMSAFAQQTPLMPVMRVMGAQQGLTNSAIDVIVRDHQGIVWMATGDGLIRHAGRGFSTLRHADTPWLPGNSIQALHVDAQDRLWISVLGKGVVRLEADRRSARLFDAGMHSSLADVWAIQDDGDTVWFGTANDGLLRWNARTDRIVSPKLSGNLDTEPKRKIVAILRRGSGDLWVATAGGLLHLLNDQIINIPLPIGAEDGIVYSLAFDGKRVWVGAAAGMFSILPGGHLDVPAWSSAFARPNAAIKIEAIAEGKMWAATQRGLRLIEGNDWRDIVIEGSLPAKPVRGLFRQKDGALWLSAPGVGAAYLRPDWARVTQLKALPGREGSLSSTDYRALAAAQPEGWWLAGTGGVLEQIDAKGRVLTRVLDIAKDLRPKALLATSDSDVWLAGRNELLRIAHGRVVKKFTAGSERDGLPEISLGELRDAGSGRFWLSIPGWGVQLRDALGHVLKEVRNNADAPIGLQSIDAQPASSLFTVIDGKLFVLEKNEANFKALNVGRESEFDAVAVASPQLIWAHAADGLHAFTRSRAGWVAHRRIMADARWKDLDGVDLRVDGQGRVWLSSSRGMFVFDGKQVHVFDVGNGLSNQQLLTGSLALAPNSAGGAAAAENGVLMLFSPPSKTTLLEWPQLAPTEISVRYAGRWQTTKMSDKAWQVPAGASEIRLRINAIAYDDPDAVHYAIRVQGVDGDWIDLGTHGERILTGLSPATYSVSLRAVDSAGRMTPVQTVLLEVEPHWWQTTLFKVIAGVLAALLAYGAFQSARQRLKRKRELKRAQEMELLHAQASTAKSTFLATLGHEIRTPMTGVLGMSELLCATALTPIQMQRVNSIRKSSEHLLRIVDDALDLARIEAGKLDFIEAQFEIPALLEEIAEWATPLSTRKAIKFKFVHNLPGGARYLGDVVRIRQVLMNLVGNAVKFTIQGGVTLTHSICGKSGTHIFKVIDTGPGMSAEACARVFGRFEQADGALTAHRHGGSGLGLAISSELVAGMQGRLTVESIPGGGSTFSMCLPLSQAPMAPLALSDQTHETGIPARFFDVLLVEDDETVAIVLSDMLTQAGHRVTHAENGLNALIDLSTQPFDLALLDLDLPGMDGFDLARQLRSMGFPGVILAVSARADLAAEQEALEAGFVRFLRKPIRNAVLLAVIEEEMREYVMQYSVPPTFEEAMPGALA